MNKVRRHIVFHGYVQGVGFRYTACYTARNYGISGWVRNLDDGSVEMEAEGFPKDIDELVYALEHQRYANVDRTVSTDIPIHGDYSFEII